MSGSRQRVRLHAGRRPRRTPTQAGRGVFSAGPFELDACEGTDAWLWVVTRGPVTRSVAVVADHAAIHARRTGTGSRSVREAVATRGFTLVFDAIRYGGEPSARIAIGHAYPRVGHATA